MRISNNNDPHGPGFVYVMREPENLNQIKIGLSIDPIRRARELDTTGRAQELDVYFAIQVEDMKRVETIIHNYFDYLRYPGTEFFMVVHPQQEIDLGNPKCLDDDTMDIYLDTRIDEICDGLSSIGIKWREVSVGYLRQKHYESERYRGDW
ncbi:GIY-YIG nuclease family protein [Shewanella algidipiscicola]|uniref:GIY-YIG nuclease family protein n=1 Tax=Shewanella algidipiscicola TaxID=614070 RepID=UPI000D7820F1|nr:GIY-YIG nuclease family protein [Shewanella algidipiscicola]